MTAAVSIIAVWPLIALAIVVIGAVVVHVCWDEICEKIAGKKK